MAKPLVQQGLAEAAEAIATGHLDFRDYFLPHAALPLPDSQPAVTPPHLQPCELTTMIRPYT
jgi:hypothetical protein